MANIINNLAQFWQYTGFANCNLQYLIMIAIGILFIFLAIRFEWEPMLLIPIGFGILIGNIPLFAGFQVGVYEQGSVFNILYQRVQKGFDPPLYRCDDRLQRPHLQSKIVAHRCGCTVRYLWCLLFGSCSWFQSK